MKNSIPKRLADFLKNYPPFEWVNPKDLLVLAQECEIIHLEKNQTLFSIHQNTEPFFYVVREGAIGLFKMIDNTKIPIDECDEGDIFGLRPFFAENQYAMTATANEESLIYAIPIAVFKPLIAENDNILNYLLSSFASNTRNPYDKEHPGKLLSVNETMGEMSIKTPFYQPINYTENPVSVSAETSVLKVAKLMTKHKIGSVLIAENQFPIGIITDKDLRTKIATGIIPLTANTSAIMSAPVLTISKETSVAEAQLIFLKNNISHLCVTENGTTTSKIVGIITLHDIFITQANNPAVFLKWIKRATSAKELKEVRDKLTQLIADGLKNNTPINHISKLTSEINTAIIGKAIQLAIEEVSINPPVTFAWLNLGSQGRKEQLLITDQDNALVFEDVAEATHSEVKSYFLTLSKITTRILNFVGYAYCPAEMMASNPKWCLSVSDWKKQFHYWISEPDEHSIMLCSIFFDFECVYGNEELATSISKSIFEDLYKKNLFFAYLGSDALKNPPPLGFFRQLLVEQDGKHKDTFDIKSRAIMPLVDAARVLLLDKTISGINNTAARFEALAKEEPENKELFISCANAFLDLMTFRTQEGLKHNNSGRFIHLETLSKSDKLKLKNAFKPIQDVQSVLKNRFNLTYFT